MLQKNQTVSINSIILRALFDSYTLPKVLKDTLTKLSKFGKNPAQIIDIAQEDNNYTVTLKVKESYCNNSVPAVMCEAYNGGQNNTYIFETPEQAEYILNKNNKISFVNLSPELIPTAQPVRLLYNNKNLVVMPATKIQKLDDYHGIIGRSVSAIQPYKEGLVQLLEIGQLLDNSNFLKLNVRGLRGV